jgi:hypothetical protein
MLVSDCYIGFEQEHSVEELIKSQQTEAGDWIRIFSIQHIREFPTNICGSALYKLHPFKGGYHGVHSSRNLFIDLVCTESCCRH